MEANVTVIDRSIDRLRELDEVFGAKLTTNFRPSTPSSGRSSTPIS
jgi:Alanine dehydrogenase